MNFRWATGFIVPRATKDFTKEIDLRSDVMHNDARSDRVITGPRASRGHEQVSHQSRHFAMDKKETRLELVMRFARAHV